EFRAVQRLLLSNYAAGRLRPDLPAPPCMLHAGAGLLLPSPISKPVSVVARARIQRWFVPASPLAPVRQWRSAILSSIRHKRAGLRGDRPAPMITQMLDPDQLHKPDRPA